jgi:hypothetical protein
MKAGSFLKRLSSRAAASAIAATMVLGSLSYSFSSAAANPHVSNAVATASSNSAQKKATKGFKHPTLASNSTEPVGLRLVSLFDVSGSIDSAEYEVQLDAMADAIESKAFQDAIFYPGGPGSIAVMFADFSDDSVPQIGWVDVREGEEWKLKEIAKELRNLKTQRRSNGGTSHVEALKAAKVYFDNSPWAGDRNVIDILTDGTDSSSYSYGRGYYGRGTPINDEPPLDKLRRELAQDYEATINALVTVVPNEDMEEYARKHLITRPIYNKSDGSPLDAGFVQAVATEVSEESVGGIIKYRKAMEKAFRRKLILEVAGLTPEDLEKYMASIEDEMKEAAVPPRLHPLPRPFSPQP